MTDLLADIELASSTTPADELQEAWRSVPRGIDEADESSTPGVDFDIWLLHVRYARSRGHEVLARLVEEYQPYAASLARRLRRESSSLDDLFQVANEALVKALQGFDPHRGLPFPAYATPTIVGSLKRYYRDQGWALRVPRRVHEITVSARQVAERLTGELGRSPTVPEVAEELDVEVDDILAAQEAVNARSTMSLDAPVGGDESATNGDRLGDPDPQLASVENRLALAQTLETLDERDRHLVDLYYFEGRSQSEIAEVVGVSQMQISRLLGRAVSRLRSLMPTG